MSYPQAPCALLLLTGRVTKPRAPTVAGARCNMAAARLAVFPTRQNLQVMKVKLTGAKKGHSLLKKKADALSMRLRALLKNIIEAKTMLALPSVRVTLPSQRSSMLLGTSSRWSSRASEPRRCVRLFAWMRSACLRGWHAWPCSFRPLSLSPCVVS